jgi:hypothetical protein
MTLATLIGAIIGSGAAIAFGRAPAQRLLVAVQNRIDQSRRR